VPTSIRPRDLAAYLSGQLDRLSPASVNLDISVMQAIFEAAKREELIDSDPSDTIERPKILAAAGGSSSRSRCGRSSTHSSTHPGRTVFITLALTAIRRIEVVNLRWRDVDLVENILRVRL
jgi:integrase